MLRPIALISDIHANAEALAAVLAVIEARQIETVYCLGDLVGYGPDPVVVVDRVRERAEVVLRGDNDARMFEGSDRMNAIARHQVRCHAKMLRPGVPASSSARERWKWLASLPESHSEEGCSFYHASPRDPVFEYVMWRDVRTYPWKMEEIFSLIQRFAFVGHTHQAGAFFEQRGWFWAREFPHGCPLDGTEKILFNVGSVGNPRDGDTRACFAILHHSFLEWVRVDYDSEPTARKLEDGYGEVGAHIARWYRRP